LLISLFKVSDIFDDIKEETIQYIQSLMWLNKLTKNYMIRKIYDISLNVGYFEWYDNQTAFIEIYKEVRINLSIVCKVNLFIIMFDNVKWK